jgi:hypothetical protein
MSDKIYDVQHGEAVLRDPTPSELAAPTGSVTTAPELLSRIQNYLECGGLFNPEMMDHNKVRDLIMDCREYITATQSPNAKLSDGEKNL